RFKSWNPYWLMPRAYVASTERVYAPKGCSCTPTDPRHVRGALNVGSKTMTSGCGGGAAAVVSAQLVGIAAGFAAWGAQSGRGAAAPTHTSCAAAVANPGAPRAGLWRDAGGGL